MKDLVVWLDSKSALVFDLKPSGIEKVFIKKSDKDHHARHKSDTHKHNKAQRFYAKLADTLKGVDHLLIMGPGLAKNNFREYLRTHYSSSIAQKVIGFEKIESFEHTTEKQMMAKAHKIFKVYNLFNS